VTPINDKAPSFIRSSIISAAVKSLHAHGHFMASPKNVFTDSLFRSMFRAALEAVKPEDDIVAQEVAKLLGEVRPNENRS
jgi:hypothetical protein